MNQNSKGTRRSHKGLRLWTHAQAQAALPYVVPVLRSLREHWIAMRSHRLRARRLTEKPGRPDRGAMIALQEEQQETHQSAISYAETQKELQALGITCVDPIRGQVLFPFKREKKLAWFIFDLFDEQPLGYWRYQDDPVDVRRLIGGNDEDVFPTI